MKIEDFSTNGVTEYWIVEADDAIVEQYLLENGDYRLALKSGSGILKCRAIEGFAISIEAIFDENANIQAIRQLFEK